MIVIKYGQCVIQIWENADLTEISIGKFKKLLKLAKDGKNEDVKIKLEFLEMLIREERETREKYNSYGVYGKKDHTYFGNKLKKIEKYKGVIKSWGI